MSKHTFISIVTGRKHALGDLSSMSLLWGEFLFPKSLQHNGAWLVPTYAGSTATLTIDSKHISAEFLSSTLPSASDVESLLNLSGYLKKMSDSGERCDEWLNMPPVEPNISESAKLRPLEEIIIRDLSALEAVFARPRSDIETVDESMLTSRARRPSKRAPAYLSAHTEDWETVGLKGVVPRKILSRVRLENYAIYENCVMVRLVDNLLLYLIQRIDRFKKVLRAYEESCDMGSELVGTRFRQNRIASFWGMLFQEQTGGDWIRQNLEKLQASYFRLQGLKNYPLYQQIPKGNQVPRDLKNSNIFSSDLLYRKGAEMWMAWRKGKQASELSLDEQKEHQQKVCEAMEYFRTLLVLHALKILFPWIKDRVEQHSIQPGLCLDLIGGSRRFTLEWKSTGELVIHSFGYELRVVSIPSNLSGIQSVNNAEELVQRFTPEVSDNKKWTLLLHLEDIGKETDASRWFNSTGNDQHSKVRLPTGLMIFGVSPLSIGSAEKVGRALRWFFASIDMQRYPHRFELQGNTPFLQRGLNEGWLEEDSKCHYSVHNLPADRNPLDQAAAEARREKANLEKRLEETSSISNPGNKKCDSYVNKGAGKQLKQQLEEANNTLQAIEHADKEITTGIQVIHSLKTCPVCPNNHENTQFQARANDCYLAICPSCDTTWEIRSAEGKRVPLLIPGGKLLPTVKDQSLDRLYGADLLAIPNTNGSFLLS